MPGMSPRIKAKKGRFGVDGLKPYVRILSPITGYTVASVGSPGTASVDFTGQALDDLLGDISSTIAWTSSLDAGIGTGKNITAAALTVGVHTITASATAGGDTITDTITVTVT